MKRLIMILSIIGLLFSSCLGMENEYAINSNGSGRLVFQYRISQMFKAMGEDDSVDAEELPLPVSKEEIEQKFGDVSGITVISVDQWEDEKDIYFKGVVEFDSVASLNSCDMFGEMPVELLREAGTTTFVQVISEGNEPVDAEALEMYRGFFEGYELVFSVTAPKKISAITMGEISADGRTATYRISMVDYIQTLDPLEFRVSW